MYTHPQLNCDLKCCLVYTQLHQYAECARACLESGTIPRECRHRLITLIQAELCKAYRRLFEEWWHPQTVSNEFFKTTQAHIVAELEDKAVALNLSRLLQTPL